MKNYILKEQSRFLTAFLVAVGALLMFISSVNVALNDAVYENSISTSVEIYENAESEADGFDTAFSISQKGSILLFSKALEVASNSIFLLDENLEVLPIRAPPLS